MTIAEVRALCSFEVSAGLERFTARDAFAPEALEDAGVPAGLVKLLIADGPAAVPERARLALGGRARSEETRRYVWGPDVAAFLLGIR